MSSSKRVSPVGNPRETTYDIEKVLVTLDPEEKEILEAFERGELKSVPNVEAELARYRQIAESSMKARKKDCRVNIRIAQQDMDAIKVRALEEGIPYQTLMASVLHKYVTGRLVEKASPPQKG